MNKQFEEAYSKTNYYRIHYKDTGLNAFSWNEEHKRYVWNDVQCSWEIWQVAVNQMDCVMIPKEITDGLDLKICDLVNYKIDCFDSERIYKLIVNKEVA